MRKKVFVMLLVLLVPFSLLSAHIYNSSYDIRTAHKYRNVEYISAKDLTDFPWDVAYIDWGNTKSKYDLEGQFKNIPMDFHFGLAFVNDGKLVKEYICNITVIQFADDVEVLLPETLLYISRIENLMVLSLST
ncbi:MAG: hypothetical protein FWC27_00190 [Firmicutes bacterium]|nr:hypothetical protein [Bacillota bacterium]